MRLAWFHNLHSEVQTCSITTMQKHVRYANSHPSALISWDSHNNVPETRCLKVTEVSPHSSAG